MNNDKGLCVVGVDLGGTKVLAGKIKNNEIILTDMALVPKQGSVEQVLKALYSVIDTVIDHEVVGIGIGVPSVVDTEKGIVYDVQNIPSWVEVHLGQLLQSRYNLPIFVNNDANCFAAGERYFGKAKPFEHVAAVILGTGFAAGLILNGKLYNGRNCGAGEFGMIPYLDHHFEYYASGQFFEHQYQLNGEEVFKMASRGDTAAIAIFQEYGTHLGNAINSLLYSIDPEIIILGGSVSKSFAFFQKTLWETINKIAYKSIAENIRIEVSTVKDVAVLGAAALLYDSNKIAV